MVRIVSTALTFLILSSVVQAQDRTGRQSGSHLQDSDELPQTRESQLQWAKENQVGDPAGLNFSAADREQQNKIKRRNQKQQE